MVVVLRSTVVPSVVSAVIEVVIEVMVGLVGRFDIGRVKWFEMRYVPLN